MDGCFYHVAEVLDGLVADRGLNSRLELCLGGVIRIIEAEQRDHMSNCGEVVVGCQSHEQLVQVLAAAPRCREIDLSELASRLPAIPTVAADRLDPHLWPASL